MGLDCLVGGCYGCGASGEYEVSLSGGSGYVTGSGGYGSGNVSYGVGQ